MTTSKGTWSVRRWPASEGGEIPESLSIEPGIARVYNGPDQAAHARLIAAAPEMLELLSNLQESLMLTIEAYDAVTALLNRIKGAS